MWVKTLILGETVKKLSSRAVAMLTNGVLALILIVVGCVCFFPAAANVSSQLEERVIRRGTSADGVSLMINVYWGTEEVDGILDVLEEYGAKATFFLGGSWADDNTACVRRIAAAGHEIGTHGYFHRDHTTLGYDGNIKEIADSVQFLSLVTGETVTLFAPCGDGQLALLEMRLQLALCHAIQAKCVFIFGYELLPLTFPFDCR